MGGGGSCLSRSAATENQDNTVNLQRKEPTLDLQAENEVEQQVEVIEVKMPIDPVPVQSALRGFMARKEMTSQLKDYRNSKIFKPEEHFQVLDQPLENLESTAMKELEKNLPTFEIEVPEDDNTVVQVKPAVKLDDGSVYQGSWDEKGNQHGVGTLITEGGAKIVGYFKEGKVEGKGRAIESCGLVYQGEFKNGKFEGEGKFMRPGGAEFVGELKDGKLSGSGQEQWPDGTRYIGEYQDGERHGKGKLILPTGVYDGDFRNNAFYGKGKFVWTNKNEYEGRWKEGEMHGKGTFKWADGRVYTGEWKSNLRDGQGEMKWPDGRIYDGEWKEGKQNGKGKYTFKTSKGMKTKAGVWVDGVKEEDSD